MINTVATFQVQIFLSLIVISSLMNCVNKDPLLDQVHISGQVDISIKEGTLTADIILSNLPQVTDYGVMLNGGLNLKIVSDSAGKISYAVDREWDKEVSYEAFHYWIRASDGEGRYLPPNLRLSYTGKFPVYRDTSEMSDWEDWKGNIAYNGTSVRASDQSVWYPIFYNRTTGEIHSAVTYNLNIRCSDCKAIYLGGNQPIRSASAQLQSNVPVPLMLFAGDFDFFERDGLTYIGTHLTSKQQNVITNTTIAIQQYYADLLNIPYGSSVTYLSATPVAKLPQWGFVTYPTIVRVGYNYGFEHIFEHGEEIPSDDVSFIAHELAHYYFGTHYRPSGPMFWPLLEGGAEYLSLQYMRDRVGAEAFRIKVLGYITSISVGENFPKLSDVDKPSEINENYRYNFFPLLLVGLEKMEGRERVIAFVREIMESNSGERADYAFLLTKLSNVGISQESFETLEGMLLRRQLTIEQFGISSH